MFIQPRPAPGGPNSTPALSGVEALLKPRSVAIVGATPRVETLGGRPIVNLRTQGFDGRIYPVNPRYEEILGLRCYPDLLALPEPPDVVLVLVGRERVFASLDEAVEARAGVAVVFGAGFAEVSGDGADRQAQLKTYAARGLRICGPNLNGIFSVSHKTALGFMPTFEFPARPGNIALIAQSGNVTTNVSSRGMEMGVGFSQIIATGNEVDLEVTDFVEYLIDDPATDVFALFIEGFKNPVRFLAVAEAALRCGKPVVVMKMGRFAASQRVALSHTGAMTGSYEVLCGALRQKGVAVVERLDDLLGVAALFATGKRPRPASRSHGGPGLAVASLSGGMAGVIADACEERSVRLARFAPETERALSAKLPGVANLANPLDMTGQVVNEPDCWGDCIEILAADPGVHILVSVLSIVAGQIERRFAEATAALAGRSDVLQLCIWPSGMPPDSGAEVLKAAGIVVHTRVEDAIGAVAAWQHYWSSRAARIAALDAHRAEVPRVPAAAAARNGDAGWALLEAAGIPVARHALVRRRDELGAVLARFEFPVALKVESAAIGHKTELNALRLGLRNAAEANAAFDELFAIAVRQLNGAAPDGILVQEMIAGKREIILGLKHEPGVGLAVVAGVGGVFSEVFRDVSIRVAPLTRFDAGEMLGELRARRMFDAVRGLAAVPPALLADLVLKLSGIAVRYAGFISELDINPLIIRDDATACVAVDVLVNWSGECPAGSAGA